jgi:hypothetical protein
LAGSTPVVARFLDRIGPERKSRWARAALITALADFTLFNGYQVWHAWPQKLAETDFRIWYSAASVGVHSGWNHLYDLTYQQSALEGVAAGSLFEVFGNPPIAAWIIAPFTLIPYPAALALWSVLILFIVVALSQGFAPGGRATRLACALSAIGFLPTFVMMEAAPLSPVVVGAVGLCALLLLRGKDLAAGAVLSLIMVKPNIALLIPLTLLVAGWWRVFLAWFVTSVALGLLSLAAIGTSGLLGFISVNLTYFQETYHLNYSLEVILGSPAAWEVAVVLVLALALVAAWMSRGGGPEIPIVAGIVATLLINHHLTPADFTMLLPAVWLLLRTRPEFTMRILGGTLWAVGWMSSLGLAWPVAAVQALVLGALAIRRRVDSGSQA